MDIFQIENLSFIYPESAKPALDNVSLSVAAGDFVVVCGQTGCGKTTLLRMLKRELSPHGERSGRILYCGRDISTLDDREAACDIGFVLQNPESQTVTDKVWHELSFGLENAGLPTQEIRRRVAEMASYFGIEGWFRRDTDSLSGGQKQLLSLASVMVMQPKVLILDEPTSQLDPIAAADFIATLQKLNRELGLTILLSEHRLEDVFPAADRVLMLQNGQVLLYEKPHAVAEKLRRIDAEHPMLSALPSACRIFAGLGGQGPCPVTVKEGRRFLSDTCTANPARPEAKKNGGGHVAAGLYDVWFRYERDLPDVLRGVSLEARSGEIFCILGGNGAGKTTTLGVLAGLLRPYRGRVLPDSKKRGRKKVGDRGQRAALLPQDVQTVFVMDTVRKDLDEACAVMGYDRQRMAEMVADISERLGISHLLDKHPYDLSGGEQQKCALAKLLITEPEILLLDEPTKGIDAFAKRSLTSLLRSLADSGVAVVAVTHDVEFAAAAADRCALFFDGQLVSEGTPQDFFSGNSFYTTAANRMARHLYPYAVTCEDVIAYGSRNRRVKP